MIRLSGTANSSADGGGGRRGVGRPNRFDVNRIDLSCERRKKTAGAGAAVTTPTLPGYTPTSMPCLAGRSPTSHGRRRSRWCDRVRVSWAPPASLRPPMDLAIARSSSRVMAACQSNSALGPQVSCRPHRIVGCARRICHQEACERGTGRGGAFRCAAAGQICSQVRITRTSTRVGQHRHHGGDLPGEAAGHSAAGRLRRPATDRRPQRQLRRRALPAAHQLCRGMRLVLDDGDQGSI